MKPDFADFLTTAGIVCLGLGLWLIYPPLALVIIGGAGILAGLFLASRRGA